VQRYPSFGGRESDSSILVNYWFWLLVVVPPALVFTARPEEDDWLKTGRLVGAVALAALFSQLVVDFDERIAAEFYAECLARIPSSEEVKRMRFNCLSLKYDFLGFRDIFLGNFAWISNVGYVTSLEIIRRIQLLHTTSIFCRKHLISNIFIFLCFPLVAALLFLSLVFFFYAFGDYILLTHSVVYGK
jgi:hypothetical protein